MCVTASHSFKPRCPPIFYNVRIVLVLEERSVFYREKKNGLYSTLPFVLANTMVNIPFLLGCTLLFLLICYWAIVGSFTITSDDPSHKSTIQGLHTGGAAFFRYLGFLYLTIFAAETQCLVVAALLPVFVAALAIGALYVASYISASVPFDLYFR